MGTLLYLPLLLSFICAVKGGKLMDTVFRCDAKLREQQKVARRTTIVLDDATKMREVVAKGEENLKTHYFQGDMMLTRKQQKVMNDALFHADKKSAVEKRAMLKDMAQLWPGGTVAYTFEDNLDDEAKDIIKAAIKHWMDNTCVKFVPRTTESDYVNFQFGDGCASRVGRLGGKQEILVGNILLKCRVGNLIHELGHTVGFFHEHSRPDRDDYVKIKWDKVKPGFEINFKKLPTDFVDSRGVPYDLGSIMHYPRTIFGNNKWDQTVAIIAEASGVEVGQRIKLSGPDISQAKKLYNCPGADHKKKSRTEKK